MKFYIVLALLITSSVFAQKTPNYYDEAFLVNVSRPVEADIASWCDNRITKLNDIQFKARNIAFKQDYKRATNYILVNLKELSKKEFAPYGPLSQNAIKRGIVVGEELSELKKNNINALKATTYFLDKYIDYIKYIINRVDRPYFRSSQCGHCGYPNQQAFENDLIELARQNLEMVNDTLIHAKAHVSLGPSELYFKATEILTYYSSLDLRSSLFANLYVCQIRDLTDIHQELLSTTDMSQFNVRTIFSKVERVIYNLLQKKGCH